MKTMNLVFKKKYAPNIGHEANENGIKEFHFFLVVKSNLEVILPIAERFFYYPYFKAFKGMGHNLITF